MKNLYALRKAGIHDASRVPMFVTLLCGVLLIPICALAQVGSGTPDASARVQVQGQAEADKQPVPETIQPKTFAGQALDQDAAVLATVPADPLFRTDPF